MKELQKLDDYFNDADPQLILDIIDDKMCELIRKPEHDSNAIKSHTSEQKLPTGHGALQELAQEQPTPVLSDAGQAAIAQIFANLQLTHEISVKVAKAVAQLGTVATPEQFGFIMRRAVRPLIQLHLPPQLASPANWNFRKERLTEEERFEEQGVNQMLPWPFHPKLVAIEEKHPTRCIAVAVHCLIWKMIRNQNLTKKEAKKFLVQPKKLYIAITGGKYDLGRKPTKKEKAEWAAATTAPSKPKVAKQDTTQKYTTQLSEDTATIDIDSDSLPDPFAPKEITPKMSDTKEDQSTENIQEEMDIMLELISDDDNDAPLKSFSTKDPTGIPKTSHHHPKKFTTKKPPPWPCHR